MLQSSPLIGILSRDLRCDVPFEDVGVTDPEFRLFLPSGLSFCVIAPQYHAHRYSGAPCLFGCSVKYLDWVLSVLECVLNI
jgi:hypothetical protein